METEIPYSSCGESMGAKCKTSIKILNLDLARLANPYIRDTSRMLFQKASELFHRLQSPEIHVIEDAHAGIFAEFSHQQASGHSKP